LACPGASLQNPTIPSTSVPASPPPAQRHTVHPSSLLRPLGAAEQANPPHIWPCCCTRAGVEPSVTRVAFVYGFLSTRCMPVGPPQSWATTDPLRHIHHRLHRRWPPSITHNHTQLSIAALELAHHDFATVSATPFPITARRGRYGCFIARSPHLPPTQVFFPSQVISTISWHFHVRYRC
jgi:hypothetical protein